MENNDDDISITLLSQMSSRSSLTFDFSAHHSSLNFKALSALDFDDVPWQGLLLVPGSMVFLRLLIIIRF